jgi:hypothetical protein
MCRTLLKQKEEESKVTKGADDPGSRVFNFAAKPYQVAIPIKERHPITNKMICEYSKYTLDHKKMLIKDRPDLTNEDYFLNKSTIVDGTMEIKTGNKFPSFCAYKSYKEKVDLLKK